MAGEEEWKNILKGVELAYNEEQDRKAEAERIAAEEVDRVRKAQEDLERREREMKEKEDRMNAQVNEVRKNELLALGCELDGDGNPFVYIPKHISPLRPNMSSSATWITAELCDAPVWEEQLKKAAEAVAARDARLSENKEFADRQALIDSRVKEMESAGARHNGDGFMVVEIFHGGERITDTSVGDMTPELYAITLSVAKEQHDLRRKVEEDRIAQEAVRKEQERVQQEAERAKEAEIERLSKLGDAGLLEEMSKHIIVASAAIAEGLNKCKSATAKLGIRKAIGHLGDAGTVIAGTLKDLK